MPDLPSTPDAEPSTAANFLAGLRSALTSVFFLVLAGTYIGMGALAHDVGVSSAWLAISTVVIWAAPAQLIMISALGADSELNDRAVWLGAATYLDKLEITRMPTVLADTCAHCGRTG